MKTCSLIKVKVQNYLMYTFSFVLIFMELKLGLYNNNLYQSMINKRYNKRTINEYGITILYHN